MIKRVETAKDRRLFANFPLKLYAKNAHYAPLFYADEKALLRRETNIYSDYSESEFFLAYDPKGNVVGRVGVILNYADIEKTGVKSARFTRLDAIDDRAVFADLMSAAEQYAVEHGMENMHGPLGYNDMDKEGLLIEGYEFDETYGGVYNYPYYKDHLETLGYVKEFDWTERLLEVGDKVDDRYVRMADIVSKRYGFYDLIDNDMSTGEIIKKYADDIFSLLDEAYYKLHGTVPFTEKAKKAMIAGLKIIVKARYISCIADKDGNLVAFGLLLPAIWHALHKSKGKLFPFGIFHFLPLLFKKPTEMEMALIGVKDAYRNSGVHTLIVARLWQNIIDDGIKEIESNANLEDNVEINNFMRQFPQRQHKRRRCYIKRLCDGE